MTHAAADTLAHLGLLASAIAAQPLEVAPLETGSAAWTDGAWVFVDDTATARDQVSSIAVQATLLAARSLTPEILSSLARRAQLARRYLAVEGHRALAGHDDVLPTFVLTYINYQLAATVDSPAASLAVAMGNAELADPPTIFGDLRPRHVRDVGATNAEAHRHVPRQQREQILRELDDGEDVDDDDERAFDGFNPVGGGGAIGRLLQKLLANSRSTGEGQPGADEQTHTTSRGRRGRSIATSWSRASTADSDGGWPHRSATYPEWNVNEHRYRPDWCTVVEVAADSAGTGRLAMPDSVVLRRPLAHLGLDLERRHRQLQGDDIDIDAAVQARAEIAAGMPPSEALYIDSVRGRRDLSVLILLDVSGSASEANATGTTVHEHQCIAAAELTSALQDLGDRVAVYGFRSQGRHAVHVIPVKRFDARFDTAVLDRLRRLVPGGYTRLGAAIRHGTSVLDEQGGTSRRLLVILSDGFAYDHGYEGQYGEADARRALAEARRLALGCLCISVGGGVDVAALRRVFGTAAHANLVSAADLPGIVGPLFRAALRLGDVQRRTSQRARRSHQRLRIEGRSR